MAKGQWNLALAAVAFLSWIGYLAFLVSQITRGPDGKSLTVSRPQILVSSLDVVGTHQGGGKFLVTAVLYSAYGAKTPRAGDSLEIGLLENLQGFHPGPADWLIPMQSLNQGESFEVVPIPPSPGYPSGGGKTGPFRIYPALPGILRQYRAIAKD
ncbi:MAG: hypothetical protein EXR99_03265 [Gemmataceae bacterium]|nr:hypothetical protein [Gemmataceae bacterium]